MKKHNKQYAAIISIIVLLSVTLQACALGLNTTSDNDPPTMAQGEDPEAAISEAAGDETPAVGEINPAEEKTQPVHEPDTVDPTDTDTAIVDHSVTIASNGELTEVEIESLVFMREEEKLARDVYLTLYDLWGLPIFQNIAESELSHTNAVKTQLDNFGIADPAVDSPTGVFVNDQLQSLYDELIGLGEQSIGDALKVGAAIEEIDILDLEEYLEVLQHPELRRVFENLLWGSENHLRAFTSTLTQQTGEIYEPQYMDSDSYDAVVSDSNRGGRRGGNRP